jgi:CRP-like cAMP-binding protein
MGTSAFKSLTVTYEPGERIVAAGERGACMFVVGSGRVRLSRSNDNGSAVEIALLEKGDFFGEMALLEGRAYAVDAEAVGEAEVVEISPGVFQRMLDGSSEIAVRMLRKLGGRLERAEASVASSEAPEPDARAGDTEAAEEEVSAPPAFGRLVQEDEGIEHPLTGEEILVGRYDPVTEIQPEIDLSPFDVKRSVSRRHARLVRSGDGWVLQEEVGVLNGTYRNGARLRPGSPVRLRDGDIVGFGMIRMVFQEA